MMLAAVVFGVAGLIVAGGWVNDIFTQLGEALIHSQSGHLQVYKSGYYAAGSRSPEKYLIEEPDRLKQRVAATPGVTSTMARLNFSGLLNNGRTDVPILGEGIEPRKENELGTFLSLTAGRFLTEQDSAGAMIGHGVAQALKLAPGDQVTLVANTLAGALNTLDLEIVGVFQSFSNDYDARAIKIPLGAAQDLLGTPGANAVVVLLKDTEATDRVAGTVGAQLRDAGMEVKTWVELNDFYEKAVALYKRQFGFLQVIVLIMVVLSVTNSVNMSVFERVGEFGTMRALGDRAGQIRRLVITENVILGATGGLLGVLMGVALGLAISAIGIPMPPPPNSNIGYTARIELSPMSLLAAFAIGFFATVLAALWPARRVSRIHLVEALRANI